MISSAATPATGEPSTTRGVSPHASFVVSPTDSSRCQIAGTSSIRIQCSCTFWRSEMSAVSRRVGLRHVGDRAQLLGARIPPSLRTRSMKYSSSSSCGSSDAVRPPSIPGLRWV